MPGGVIAGYNVVKSFMDPAVTSRDVEIFREPEWSLEQIVALQCTIPIRIILTGPDMDIRV